MSSVISVPLRLGTSCAIAAWLCVASVSAQEGHPLTGTWIGDVGPQHVTLALDWDGKNVTGTINPGPNAAAIENVAVDFKAWTVRIEAAGKTRILIAGRIDNPGSANRVLRVAWSEAGTTSQTQLSRVDSMSSSSNSGEQPRMIIYDGLAVTLRGRVTHVEWINPRVRFAVSDIDSKASWIVEVPDGATALERNGYNARTLKAGDTVTVKGAAAAGVKNRALASSVTIGRGAGAQLFKLSITARAPFAPTPRWPDGQVRLGPPQGAKGYWKADAPDVEPAGLKTGEVAAMPWAKGVYAHRQATKLRDDPAGRCVPAGGPRQFLGPQGFQFVDQRQRILVLLGDGDRNWRVIATDGRPLAQPAEVVPSYYGTSVGHWEKDTLIVDSIGYNEKFWFLSAGLPHTEALHLTERFTRTDMNTLKYDVTVDDARTYTKPWNAGWTMRWVPDQEIQEFFCEEKTS